MVFCLRVTTFVDYATNAIRTTATDGPIVFAGVWNPLNSSCPRVAANHGAAAWATKSLHGRLSPAGAAGAARDDDEADRQEPSHTARQPRKSAGDAECRGLWHAQKAAFGIWLPSLENAPRTTSEHKSTAQLP